MNFKQINRKDAKISIKILADYVKRGNSEELIKKLSYLTGLHATFYGLALVDELTESEKQKFLDTLQKIADPVEKG